jgi:hypothetical protein
VPIAVLEIPTSTAAHHGLGEQETVSTLSTNNRHRRTMHDFMAQLNCFRGYVLYVYQEAAACGVSLRGTHGNEGMQVFN